MGGMIWGKAVSEAELRINFRVQVAESGHAVMDNERLLRDFLANVFASS